MIQRLSWADKKSLRLHVGMMKVPPRRRNCRGLSADSNKPFSDKRDLWKFLAKMASRASIIKVNQFIPAVRELSA